MGERNRTVLSKQALIPWSITFWKVFVTTLIHSCTCKYGAASKRSPHLTILSLLMLETTEDSSARGRRIGGENENEELVVTFQQCNDILSLY